jgi:DNA repair exonuclease SbcCD ATPase subunit
VGRARKGGAVEQALDELYGADPNEFVPTRQRLAKELGPEAGKELAGQRKPTVAAWAVNRLVRERDGEVGKLVRAGARLRKLQAQLVAGQRPEGVDDAVRDVRERISRLADAALEVVREAGQPASEATAERVFETLFAAVADEERSDELQRGRLTREWQSAGFGFASAPVPSPQTQRAAKPRRDETRRKAAQEKVQKARDAVKAAREDMTAKEAEIRRLERELQRAANQVETARTRLSRAEDALERARADAGS